jgi:hypothetical protein
MEKDRKKLKKELSIYKPLIDLDEEIRKRKANLDSLQISIEKERDREKELENNINTLQKRLNSIEEKDEFSSFAFFDKVYDFENSMEYDLAMKGNRDKQKEMIKGEEAVMGDYSLTYNGSHTEGKKLLKVI